MTLEAEQIMNIHVQCGRDMETGDDGSGYLRVIPILKGSFEGKVNGVIIPGGADWNTQRETGYSHVFAKYLLKTDDGAYIAVENVGNISFEEGNIIKTTPRFQTDAKGPYAWMNHGVYVASLSGGEEEGTVEITVYRMK